MSEVGPVLITVYGVISVDEDLTLFVDRYVKAELAPAIVAAISYLKATLLAVVSPIY